MAQRRQGVKSASPKKRLYRKKYQSQRRTKFQRKKTVYRKKKLNNEIR